MEKSIFFFLNFLLISSGFAEIQYEIEGSVCIFKNVSLKKYQDFSPKIANSSNVKVVRFVNSNLYTIPKQIFKIFNNLNIVEVEEVQQVEELSNHIFEDARSVFYLRFHKNGIRLIHKETFVGLEKLHMMDLSYNKLKRIPEKGLYPLQTVEVIMLDNNEIEILHPTVFKKNLNLKWITLNSNNLFAIHQDAFVSLKKLDYLELSDNVCINNAWVIKAAQQMADIRQKLAKCHSNYTSQLVSLSYIDFYIGDFGDNLEILDEKIAKFKVADTGHTSSGNLKFLEDKIESLAVEMQSKNEIIENLTMDFKNVTETCKCNRGEDLVMSFDKKIEFLTTEMEVKGKIIKNLTQNFKKVVEMSEKDERVASLEKNIKNLQSKVDLLETKFDQHLQNRKEVVTEVTTVEEKSENVDETVTEILESSETESSEHLESSETENSEYLRSLETTVMKNLENLDSTVTENPENVENNVTENPDSLETDVMGSLEQSEIAVTEILNSSETEFSEHLDSSEIGITESVK